MDMPGRAVDCPDGDIEALRRRYPDGLRFVVGDTHGEQPTLRALLEKIRFDPQRDRVYLLGDYNAGGDPRRLLDYIGKYYEPDPLKPGLHLIRGNHERELWPLYTLETLPDILVLRGRGLNFFLVHAGMVASAFALICADMAAAPEQQAFAYRLDDAACCHDAPLRQIIWSRRGLYSQRSRWKVWPSERWLLQNAACIIHGHTPYSFFHVQERRGYGGRSLFFPRQRIWFAEDLQSFDIDSDIKGRNAHDETYRGLSCLCLEALEEIASRDGGALSIDGLCAGPSPVFSRELVERWGWEPGGDIDAVLRAKPQLRTIAADPSGRPYLSD